MKAILLHHAGGDKYAFRNIQQGLLPEIESIALELPGRSDRYEEALLSDIHTAVDDLYIQILPHINEPYCIIGNSMGAILAFLLVIKLTSEHKNSPTQLFLASRLSPDAYKNEPNCIGIPSDDFWKVVQQYNGVPQQLLEHSELKEFYEPILRADFEMLQKYNESFSSVISIDIPMTILFGNTDVKNITKEMAQGWRKFTTAAVEIKGFDGGHFFLYENSNLISFIKEKLFC